MILNARYVTGLKTGKIDSHIYLASPFWRWAFFGLLLSLPSAFLFTEIVEIGLAAAEDSPFENPTSSVWFSELCCFMSLVSWIFSLISGMRDSISAISDSRV